MAWPSLLRTSLTSVLTLRSSPGHIPQAWVNKATALHCHRTSFFLPHLSPVTPVPTSLISAPPPYLWNFLKNFLFLVSSWITPPFPAPLSPRIRSQGSPALRIVPLLVWGWPHCFQLPPALHLPSHPHRCSSVSVLPPSLGGLASLLSLCSVSWGLLGWKPGLGSVTKARKENSSRHDIYVGTSKWSLGCGGGRGGWQAKARLRSDLAPS